MRDEKLATDEEEMCSLLPIKDELNMRSRLRKMDDGLNNDKN